MADTQEVKRKLRAILSADVKGYSTLMTNDEAFTIQSLKKSREIMSEFINTYSGRVVDTPGDNVMAEFSSVVNAVQSAIAIQKALSAENADIPHEKRLEFRIGINIGDVVQDGNHLYGEGVNIAARIEAIAEPGGVCISRGAYDHIRNKLNLGYEYLGEHLVKNIKQPVRVYKILTDPGDAGKLIGEKPKPQIKSWVWPTIVLATFILTMVGYHVFQKITQPEFEPASIKKMAYRMPDAPSIAVLPFDNISNDDSLEYFCDGLTEEIISALSKVPELFTIARDSVFTYKGEPVKVKRIAEELGIRYVLEGTVREADSRLRITAKLVDALEGKHLWTERYDRNFEDIFALQDEITMNVMTALQVKLAEGEKFQALTRSTTNLDAYLKWTQGRRHFLRLNKEDCIKARQLLQEAIELDPGFASPYVDLAWTHIMGIRFGLSKSPKESLEIAAKLAEKAIILDESSPFAHCVLSAVFTARRQYEKAIAQGEKAVSLSPGDSLAIAHFARSLAYAGKYEKSLSWFEKAIRLDPKALNWYLTLAGHCDMFMGRYDEAIKRFKKVLQGNPRDETARIRLTAAYSLSGQKENAKIQAEKILQQNPEFSVKSIKKWSINSTKDRDLLINALIKSGLPERSTVTQVTMPSIAVLPFDNMSGDPEQEYFSDGITVNIITALSKSPKIVVIARNSAFSFKSNILENQQISKKLGVRYLLKGSVQKFGNQFRISSQLIDAFTGELLWADQYDRGMENIFAVQDQITREIILALQIQLTHGEQARIYSKGTNNFNAYLKAMQAQWHSYLSTVNGNLKARLLAQEAIELDRGYAYAHRILGATHVMDVFLGISKSPKESLTNSIEVLKKAISLDSSFAAAYVSMGYVNLMLRKHDEAVRLGKIAFGLEPNSPDVLFLYASILTYSGMVDEAVPLFRRALRLNPIPPNSYYRSFGHALRLAGSYEEAIELQSKAIEREPDDILAYIILATCTNMAGLEKEAEKAAQQIIRIDPEFSVKRLIAPFKDRSELKRTCMALRKSGLALDCETMK